MLFVLTGEVQTGKTRWLERLVHDLENAGVAPYGVLAPGIWEDRRNALEAFPQADANGFEKLGIENVLLPTRERIMFAQRVDLAEKAKAYDPDSQSAQANLHWHISDTAIDRVNAHFSDIATMLSALETPGFLIVDELGQLELNRNEGLVDAVALLEAGPFPTVDHALVVVRESLLPQIEGRFERWGRYVRVSPDESSRSRILAELSASR